jgi:hypothetical protein
MDEVDYGYHAKPEGFEATDSRDFRDARSLFSKI